MGDPWSFSVLEWRANLTHGDQAVAIMLEGQGIGPKSNPTHSEPAISSRYIRRRLGVRISNIGLNSTDLSKIYSSAPNTMGYWKAGINALWLVLPFQLPLNTPKPHVVELRYWTGGTANPRGESAPGAKPPLYIAVCTGRSTTASTRYKPETDYTSNGPRLPRLPKNHRRKEGVPWADTDGWYWDYCS